MRLGVPPVIPFLNSRVGGHAYDFVTSMGNAFEPESERGVGESNPKVQLAMSAVIGLYAVVLAPLDMLYMLWVHRPWWLLRLGPRPSMRSVSGEDEWR